MAANLEEPARKEWKELGEPSSFKVFWHKRIWDAAPKEKCGEARPGYNAALPPDWGIPKAQSPAQWVCRIMAWDLWSKGCQAVSPGHVVAWDLDYAYAEVSPDMSGEKLAWFEWRELSPVLFFYWAVADYKKLDAISVRLKNGKCKTVSRQLGLELDRKWEEKYAQDGKMSRDSMMTDWFREGWEKVKESECPAAR